MAYLISQNLAWHAFKVGDFGPILDWLREATSNIRRPPTPPELSRAAPTVPIAASMLQPGLTPAIVAVRSFAAASEPLTSAIALQQVAK